MMIINGSIFNELTWQTKALLPVYCPSLNASPTARSSKIHEVLLQVCNPERMDSCLHPEAGHSVSSETAKNSSVEASRGPRNLEAHIFLGTHP